MEVHPAAIGHRQLEALGELLEALPGERLEGCAAVAWRERGGRHGVLGWASIEEQHIPRRELVIVPTSAGSRSPPPRPLTSKRLTALCWARARQPGFTLGAGALLSIRKYDGAHGARDLQRGLQTKNLVKGAAGGARGVDYQDAEGEFLERRDKAGGASARSVYQEGQAKNAERLHQARRAEQAKEALQGSAADTQDDTFDPRKLVNQQAAPKETPEQQRQKLEVEKLKKKLLGQGDSEDETDDDDDDAEDAEEDADGAVNEASDSSVFADASVDRATRKARAEVLARLLDDPEVEMRVYGTVHLRSAQSLREVFKTPLRIARHLNVLAQRLATSPEQRAGVVSSLADTIVELGPGLGRRSLSSFMHGVGIGEVYPLEVLEHIVLHHPRFLPQTGLRPFLTSPPRLEGEEGVPIEVRCDPALKLTGFALKGGGFPGYAFEPQKEPGCFALNIDTRGRYTLLLLAVDAAKNESLQELRVRVKPAKAARQEEHHRGPPRQGG